MVEIKTNKGRFLVVEIPASCVNFVCDMGYLIFKMPAYENWVTDKELANPFKLDKYLDRVQGKDEWKNNYIKLPEGNFKFIGATRTFLADHHPSTQNITEEVAQKIVDDNGMGCWDNYRLKKDEKYTCTSAIASVKCLLETAGVDEKKFYAILMFVEPKAKITSNMPLDNRVDAGGPPEDF